MKTFIERAREIESIGSRARQRGGGGLRGRWIQCPGCSALDALDKKAGENNELEGGAR